MWIEYANARTSVPRRDRHAIRAVAAEGEAARIGACARGGRVGDGCGARIRLLERQCVHCRVQADLRLHAWCDGDGCGAVGSGVISRFVMTPDPIWRLTSMASQYRLPAFACSRPEG